MSASTDVKVLPAVRCLYCHTGLHVDPKLTPVPHRWWERKGAGDGDWLDDEGQRVCSVRSDNKIMGRSDDDCPPWAIWPHGPEPVQTVIWETYRHESGFDYMRPHRRKSVKEVHAELRDRLGRSPEDCDEYFDPYAGDTGGDWPEGRIAIFPVTGDCEGDYIHVEVIHQGRARLLLLGKTFGGRDAAWRFARTLADMLGV